MTRSEPDRAEQWQSTADETGFSRLRLESEWWGNEKFGQWVKDVWALIDFETDDAYHISVVALDSAHLKRYRPYDHQTDLWFPKEKAEVVVEPEWNEFDAIGETKGEVIVAMEKHTKYGYKIAMWGDTYDALSDDGDAVLADYWDALHATYDGECWTADEVNGILIGKLTNAGYDVKIAEGVMD